MSRKKAVVAEFARYLRTETVGGTVLLVATAIALIWANSPLSPAYVGLRDLHAGPLTVGEWATDGLLAIFFFAQRYFVRSTVSSGVKG